jgi:uncharacterized protein (TIGR02246 family)
MATSVATQNSAEAVIHEFSKAWNRHDAKALAALFAPEGDLINPGGRPASGKADLEQFFGEEHTGYLKDSHMDVKIRRVQQLRPDVAIVTVDMAMTGMREPGSDERSSGDIITTFVLENQDGAWHIVTARPMRPAGPPR